MKSAKVFLSIFLMTVCAFVVSGQKANKSRKALTKPAICQLNELAFQCPKGFSSFFKNEEEGLWLFRENTEKQLGLYISVPKTTFDEDDLFDDLTKKVVARLFPTQPQKYEWAKAGVVQFADNETPMSKDQISSKTVKGYNKKHLVIGNFRHIVFNEKHFVVGYFMQTDTGSIAEEMFRTDFSDAAYVSCDSQLKLIHSVTGEKIEKGTDPCEVTVEAAQ